LRLLLAIGLRQSGLKAEKLMDVDSVLAAARRRRRTGSGRFCMGAAWRNPKDRDMDALCTMVAGVKAMGLETCMTLGMLEPQQADRLAAAGPRLLQPQSRHLAGKLRQRHHHPHLAGPDRHAGRGARERHERVLRRHRRHGRDREDRVGFIHALATLPEHPGSVPINALVPIRGTPLGDMLADVPGARIDDIEFVRTVAAARITMPRSMVRLSAGRESMSESTQALCFLAGANSIFTGDKLLTTGNAGAGADAALFAKLGLRAMEGAEPRATPLPVGDRL
jgi:biotin synthase